MRVFVDQETCIGCGLCCGICESVFRMNEDDKAEAYREVEASAMSAVQSAIDSCPVAAIGWKD